MLAQFVEDGGNREQALNYHLFSWELCWHARRALLAAAKPVSAEVDERLARAGRFYWEVQARREPWDYGDSDNAFVSPWFTTAGIAISEWRGWLRGSSERSSLEYWLGAPPAAATEMGAGEPLHATAANDWWIYPTSGMAICDSSFWRLRWDLSPLGYLKPAAHGHLDALHLSIWFKDLAVIIDPGTGAYYADYRLRSWLASGAAHNGPRPAGEEYPKRRGLFLWGEHHPAPTWKIENNQASAVLTGELRLPQGILQRSIKRLEPQDGWEVEDKFDAKPGIPNEFTVHWQLPPGAWVKRLQERRFSINRADVSLVMEVGTDWAAVQLVEKQSDRGGKGRCRT